jgi:hypothetical protein
VRKGDDLTTLIVPNIEVVCGVAAETDKVDNGIRVVITLKQHTPSNLTIAGYRVLVSYGGQPMTCCGYNKPGHLINARPLRQRDRDSGVGAQTPT